jgi:hypothetical protein
VFSSLIWVSLSNFIVFIFSFYLICNSSINLFFSLITVSNFSYFILLSSLKLFYSFVILSISSFYFLECSDFMLHIKVSFSCKSFNKCSLILLNSLFLMFRSLTRFSLYNSIVSIFLLLLSNSLICLFFSLIINW